MPVLRFIHNTNKAYTANMTSIKEAVETFKTKYNFPDISSVTVDEEFGVIHVFTHNAKIWVDLPERHQGFLVKMNVIRRSKAVGSGK